jgi:hypothetical protein
MDVVFFFRQMLHGPYSRSSILPLDGPTLAWLPYRKKRARFAKIKTQE